MHFLFVKPSQNWPRSSGHDVHGYYMMQALAALGHEVSLTTQEPPSDAAVAGLMLRDQWTWGDASAAAEGPPLTGLQERFRSYWGIENSSIQAIRRQAEVCGADVVVAVGLEVLPLLARVQCAQRVWYAADEWIWHHLSVVRLRNPSTWSHVRTAAIKGLYEFAFRTAVDRVWVVSEKDRRAMRLLARMRQVDVVPNGVDTEHYRPLEVAEQLRSCIFWGRLDFEPNIQALEWFCRQVWPRLRQRFPDAEFRLFGFNPVDEVLQLAREPGITFQANLPDLRQEIARCQVVVLPFQSGGGIKNKLLEAASMARPIVCSRRACNGLVLPLSPALMTAGRPEQWISAIGELWSDAERRRSLGQAARQWVMRSHSWEASAQLALAGLAGAPALRYPTPAALAGTPSRQATPA